MKPDTVPNISEFLVGGKTAIYEDKQSYERTGTFEVVFGMEYLRVFKIRAKRKRNATSLARNRMLRSVKNLRGKRAESEIYHVNTRSI